MSRPRITLLCRGSTRVGLGHVMRTRTVADALEPHAVVRVILIGDASAATLLRDRPWPSLRVDDDAAAAAAVAATRPHAVTMDLTTLTPAAFAQSTGGGRIPVASLSPVFDRLEEVPVLFHRARRHPLGPRPGWRMGPEWAVVRPEVAAIPEASFLGSIDPGRPLPVAVCMGGGDAANLTRRVLERLRCFDRPLLVWALLGEGYRHSFDELERAARADRRHEVILARTTHSMWHVLRGCAVAVLAGGTVTYEAAAAGLPSVNLLADPGQSYLIDDLVSAGAAFHGGGLEGDLSPMLSAIDRLEADREGLLLAHRAARGLVDGRAAERIARELLALAAEASSPLRSALGVAA